MQVITHQKDLIAFCQLAAQQPYLTVDTEFLRENTFYAKLCLLQMAFPGEANAVVVDVLEENIDLAPVLELFQNSSVVKVFHAARQDLEIFHHDYGVLPYPFFDTQIAAMVEGFGDQVGYETLVRSISKGKIDKSSRFTDWQRRPLSKSQLEYAVADVTYLREIYEFLKNKLEETGRIEWVREEFTALLDAKLYDPPPEEAWKRVRSRVSAPKFLAYMRELATFREVYAREKNVPRSRVFKDDALLEAAAQKPADAEALKKLRLWRGGVKAEIAQGVIEAIKHVDLIPASEYPLIIKRNLDHNVEESVLDLLRVYLKAQSAEHQVATKLICSAQELEEFAFDPEKDSPLNQGWRYEVFGRGARGLIEGRAALIADGKYVRLKCLKTQDEV